jgi:hypothetical protein
MGILEIALPLLYPRNLTCSLFGLAFATFRQTSVEESFLTPRSDLIPNVYPYFLLAAKESKFSAPSTYDQSVTSTTVDIHSLLPASYYELM